jgi:hypothetical protein
MVRWCHQHGARRGKVLASTTAWGDKPVSVLVGIVIIVVIIYAVRAVIRFY